MRKINKNLKEIRESLIVADENLTHQRRKELIKAGKYIKETKFDSRYKMPDIKDKLRTIYYSKCAYCESLVEQGHVEHYRPKDVYYWLAYSWDNLLYGCPTCNQNKGTDFDILGEQVNPPKDTEDLSEINIWSSQVYDSIEKPSLLNPERDEMDDVFLFDIQGHIKDNNNTRADYTIKTCHLDRAFLVDERRKVLDDFMKELSAELLGAKNKEEQKAIISSWVKMFLYRSKDEKNTYMAYRKAAVVWLDDIVKKII